MSFPVSSASDDSHSIDGKIIPGISEVELHARNRIGIHNLNNHRCRIITIDNTVRELQCCVTHCSLPIEQQSENADYSK